MTVRFGCRASSKLARRDSQERHLVDLSVVRAACRFGTVALMNTSTIDCCGAHFPKSILTFSVVV